MKLFILCSLVSLSISTVSCANPNYSNENNTAEQSQNSANCNNNCTLNFAKSNFQANLIWSSSPAVENESPFQLSFNESQNYTVTARLFMPSMGHGSAPIKLEKLDTKNYAATNVYFTMGGAWQLIISLKQGNTLIDQAIVDIEL